ncbi:hypothetical protein BC831DRAFT_449457, partial [Entophlyctis helioformis]
MTSALQFLLAQPTVASLLPLLLPSESHLSPTMDSVTNASMNTNADADAVTAAARSRSTHRPYWASTLERRPRQARLDQQPAVGTAARDGSDGSNGSSNSIVRTDDSPTAGSALAFKSRGGSERFLPHLASPSSSVWSSPPAPLTLPSYSISSASLASLASTSPSHSSSTPTSSASSTVSSSTPVHFNTPASSTVSDSCRDNHLGDNLDAHFVLYRPTRSAASSLSAGAPSSQASADTASSTSSKRHKMHNMVPLISSKKVLETLMPLIAKWNKAKKAKKAAKAALKQQQQQQQQQQCKQDQKDLLPTRLVGQETAGKHPAHSMLAGQPAVSAIMPPPMDYAVSSPTRPRSGAEATCAVSHAKDNTRADPSADDGNDAESAGVHFDSPTLTVSSFGTPSLTVSGSSSPSMSTATTCASPCLVEHSHPSGFAVNTTTSGSTTNGIASHLVNVTVSPPNAGSPAGHGQDQDVGRLVVSHADVASASSLLLRCSYSSLYSVVIRSPQSTVELQPHSANRQQTGGGKDSTLQSSTRSIDDDDDDDEDDDDGDDDDDRDNAKDAHDVVNAGAGRQTTGQRRYIRNLDMCEPDSAVIINDDDTHGDDFVSTSEHILPPSLVYHANTPRRWNTVNLARLSLSNPLSVRSSMPDAGTKRDKRREGMVAGRHSICVVPGAMSRGERDAEFYHTSNLSSSSGLSSNADQMIAEEDEGVGETEYENSRIYDDYHGVHESRQLIARLRSQCSSLLLSASSDVVSDHAPATTTASTLRLGSAYQYPAAPADESSGVHAATNTTLASDTWLDDKLPQFALKTIAGPVPDPAALAKLDEVLGDVAGFVDSMDPDEVSAATVPAALAIYQEYFYESDEDRDEDENVRCLCMCGRRCAVCRVCRVCQPRQCWCTSTQAPCVHV